MFCSLLLHISFYIAVSLTALVFCIGDAMNLLFSLFFIALLHFVCELNSYYYYYY